MIVIVNYGVGNLSSVLNAFQLFNDNVAVSSDVDVILNASKIVLPGVGSYKNCIDNFVSNSKLKDAVLKKIDSGTPTLGICVGMQILSTIGMEFGVSNGLNIIKGKVEKIDISAKPSLKLPHMGWNNIKLSSPHKVFENLDNKYFYFVHSYHFKTDDKNNEIAFCNYGVDITASVAKNNVIGVQFHPEKSQKNGLKLIENFINWDGK